jgi:hypothetical protein
MSKQWAGLLFGVVVLSTACAVSVDEPSLEEALEEALEEEDVDQQEVAAGMELFRPRIPRITRLNPIDPGWRLLGCLPDPRKDYIAHDPDVCAAIRFFCPSGSEPFFDQCGCGCIVRSGHTGP